MNSNSQTHNAYAVEETLVNGHYELKISTVKVLNSRSKQSKNELNRKIKYLNITNKSGFPPLLSY